LRTRNEASVRGRSSTSSTYLGTMCRGILDSRYPRSSAGSNVAGSCAITQTIALPPAVGPRAVVPPGRHGHPHLGLPVARRDPHAEPPFEVLDLRDHRTGDHVPERGRRVRPPGGRRREESGHGPDERGGHALVPFDVDTGNDDRDASVKASHLLDVAQRPTLKFRSTSIVALDDEGSYAITGDVTIGDVTRPVTLHAEFGGAQPAQDGVCHAGFEAVADLRRKEFGIGVDIPGAAVGDVVKIELDVQLIAPQSREES
jgi:YceI-like domain